MANSIWLCSLNNAPFGHADLSLSLPPDNAPGCVSPPPVFSAASTARTDGGNISTPLQDGDICHDLIALIPFWHGGQLPCGTMSTRWKLEETSPEFNTSQVLSTRLGPVFFWLEIESKSHIFVLVTHSLIVTMFCDKKVDLIGTWYCHVAFYTF